MRKLLSTAAFMLFALWASPVSAAGDLNCSDFGTRERAQREFESQYVDVHDLDRDDDGKACEANGSTGWWPWPVAAVGLVTGRAMARRRAGDHHMLPGWEGFLFNYEFTEDGDADKVLDRMLPVWAIGGVVALPVVNVLRDWVLPRSATPIALYVVVAVLATLSSYAAVTVSGKVIADAS